MNERPLPAGRRAAEPSLAGVAGARLPSPLVETVDDRLAARGVRLLLKRDDLIHPDLPGNKWRKLGPNLTRAQELGHRGVLTFGGAYSNHLRAVAAAGRLLGLRTIGVIRGEEHRPLNPVLRFAADAGMHLTYLDRASYRAVRAGTGAAVLAELDAEFGPAYLLPEGASNALGVRGCAELPAEIDQHFDVLCCSCGTGGTLAGLAGGLPPGRRALGVAVLRGAAYLDADLTRLQAAAFGAPSGNWTIIHDFHAGGYARSTPELARFLIDFRDRHGLALDAVYEGKLLHALYSLVAAGAFAPGQTLVAVINALADGPRPPAPGPVAAPG